VITGFGGAGYDFESVQWVPLFEGPYSVAKVIMARLEEKAIPNRLTFPEEQSANSMVVIEVMRRWLPEARPLSRPSSD
jgi:hypothetical protein